MAEDIAGQTFGSLDLHGEWVGIVEARCRHRQTNHDPRACIEFLWGQHEERVHILHFPARLRIAVDPDHVAAMGTPVFARSHQSSSFPTLATAIASPPC